MIYIDQNDTICIIIHKKEMILVNSLYNKYFLKIHNRSSLSIE